MNSDLFTLADIADNPGSDMFAKTRRSHAYRADFKEKGYYTYERVALTAPGNRVLVRDGAGVRQMVMMASNNFLGLSSHPRIVAAGKKALETYGAGSGGAPMLSGTTSLHRRLEERCAAFLGRQAAVLFSTGYAGNMGTMAALLRKGETAILDELVHASIIDGTLRSEGRLRTFSHNDMASLEQALQASTGRARGTLVVVDGAYSMHGDLCRLPEIVELVRRYKARLMVDEAHCVGVLGENGRGVCEHFGMQNQVDVVVGTFSKSLGVLGGFVATGRETASYLKLFARSYFFSTAPAPAQVACALEAFDVMEAEPERREQLWKNVTFMQNGFRQLGFDIGHPHCGIISVVIGDELRLRTFSKALHEAGIYASAVPFPAVPQGGGRMRFGLMATHTQEDLEVTLSTMERLGKAFGVIT